MPGIVFTIVGRSPTYFALEWCPEAPPEGLTKRERTTQGMLGYAHGAPAATLA